MATNFQYRLLLIVPEGAKVAAVVTWFLANIGPDSVAPADQWPALNPSGLASDPVTHRWTSGAFDSTDAREILKRACTLAGVTPPTNAQWNGWTKAERISWLLTVRNALLSGWGMYIQLSGNADTWDSAEAALTAMGLKRKQAA